MGLQNQALVVKNSTDSMGAWICRDHITSETRRRLSHANVLLVPSEGYIDRPDLLYFPGGTDQLLEFLRRPAQEPISVDICIEDDDYRELVLSADDWPLATTIVLPAFANLVVRLIANYVNRRAQRGSQSATVRAKLIVQDDHAGTSLEFSYEGPASEYTETLTAALRKYGYSAPSPSLAAGNEPTSHIEPGD